MPDFSGIDKHKRNKKKLISPLNQLPISPIDWIRDILPEHLWIEFLRQKYSETAFLELHSELCKTLQYYFEENLAFLGLISDFGRIRKDSRLKILDKHDDLIIRAFAEPFGSILKLYPKAPCYWLLPEEWLKGNNVSPADAIARLSETIEKLLPSKDPYCAYLRMIPLRRIFEEGKIRIPHKMKTIVDLFPKYPHLLSDRDKSRCESIGRAMLGPILALGNYVNVEWAKYFWRRNFELSSCQIKKQPISSRKVLDKDLLNKVNEISEANVKILSKYLQAVSRNYKFDLYAPEKDEVTLGLFSRIVRLASSIHENPFLWSIDFSRIVLRCLSDTAITFCYLITKKDDNLFTSFIEYSKGKEKLLLLHLQDTHLGKIAPSGETTEVLVNQLGGGLSPALIDINLGDWKDVSARDMAKECDLLDIYRVIYDPTSSDIHGTWTSIRTVNLTYCVNPLHRFHRLPQTEPPPLFLHPLEIAIDIVQRAIKFAQTECDFPKMKTKLKRLPEPKT